jgi:periplasmic protein TonB
MDSSFSPDRRGRLLDAPITRGLLLSAALHLAFIVLFQASPIGSGRQVVVINAHLQAAEARAPDTVEPAEQTQNAELLAVESRESEAALSAPIAEPVTEPIATPIATAPVEAAPPTENAVPVADAALAPVDMPAPQTAQVGIVERGATQSSTLPGLPIGIDDNWYLARQVDKHPKAIGEIKPTYPEHAKLRNIEGTLKLMLKIDELGRVRSAEVVEAIPPGVFDEAALAVFREARFQPAIKDGRAVRYQAYMRVEFMLKD